MASLRYSQIRSHPGAAISYIANRDKMISSGTHDVFNVLSYMGEPESTERVYSFARHCSCNPDLAAKQMELYRARYYESKGGGIQGLQEGKAELLGLHFFLSYSEEDNPSEETMNAIVARLAEHPLLRNHAVFTANHYDKAHKHTHFYACQYSAVGKPRKMCMRTRDYNDLRKYANRLCVEHGLSIIDLPALRCNDPEYSAWVNGVIAAGKVTVHPEREEHKGARRQKVSTRKIYYRWLKDSEEFNAAEELRLTKAQLDSKRAAETYFWNFTNDPKQHPYYVSNDPRKRYYAVKRYDENGRQRSLVELILLLIIVIVRSEAVIGDVLEDYTIRARVNRKVQTMMDSIQLSRELNANTPAEVTARLVDTGRQMNEIKKEKSRLEACVQRQEAILAAWEQYDWSRAFVEGNDHPDPEILAHYKAAHAVAFQHQILTDDDFEELQIRHQFQLKKLADYQKRMADLNRQYRGLKHLEALVTRPTGVIESMLKSKDLSLDDQIRTAENIKPVKSNTQPSHGPLREE